MHVYFDLSDLPQYTSEHSTVSGIQRVSLQILAQTIKTYGAERIRVIRYDRKTDNAVWYPAEYSFGDISYCQARFKTEHKISDLDRYIQARYGLGRRRAMLHSARIRIANVLTNGRYFRKRGLSLNPTPAQRPSLSIAKARDAFSSGDVVFICGATWGLNRYYDFLARERRTRGIRVLQFIHDLMPLLAPEFVIDHVPRQFTIWLEHMSKNVDGFITNSQATKRDLDEWLAHREVKANTRVLPLAHQFALASRLPSSPAAPWHVDERIRARVRNAARMPFVLCPGTMEPRKNNWALANVWRRVHQKLGDATPRLVFAGNPGWMRDDFDGFLSGTGHLYGYISVIERPSDPELEFLYRSCLFSVFVSLREGWGLPIGEGLWLGRPVICSNVGSMPEVGGSLADYVDPTSLDSIEAAVLRLITDRQYRDAREKEIACAELRTWGDVADDLWPLLTNGGL